MSPDDLTIEHLFSSMLDSEEPDAPASALHRTPDCPSYIKFESHVRGLRHLLPEELRHVNKCADYCQAVLHDFRQRFRPSALRFGHTAPQRLAAHQSSDRGHFYDAVVEDERGDVLGKARILVTDGPFLTETGHLVLRVVVTEPNFPPEVMPIELSIGDPASTEPTSEPIFTFDLPSQANEILKTKVPANLLTQEMVRQAELTGLLPFSFVVRTLGRPGLLSMG